MNRKNWEGPTRMQLQQWHSLKYYKPGAILADLHHQAKEKNLSWDGLIQKDHKKIKEAWMAAAFALGLQKCILNRPVGVGLYEEDDYDCVLSWDGTQSPQFRPVQLKELPSIRKNAKETLYHIIKKLRKYPDSSGLTVAIYGRRAGPIIPSLYSQIAEETPVAEIWLFGARPPTGQTLFLLGDFRTVPKLYEFENPIPSSYLRIIM